MPLNRSAVLALVALFLAFVDATAQEPYSPLAPRGHVRFGILGDYSSFSEVYQIGANADGPYRLGDQLSGPVGSTVFPFLASAESAVKAAIEDDYQMSLGSMSSVLEKSLVRVPFALDVGVFDWLTVGAAAPLLQNETEFTGRFADDVDAANAGFNPGLEDPAGVSVFLDGLQGAIGAYDVYRGQACATDPTSEICQDATALTADARNFHSLLSLMYGSAFAPLSWSDAGMALAERLAAFSAAFAEAGIAALPGSMPLAEVRATPEDMLRLVSEPGFGIEATHPLEAWLSPWRIGDVEVRADARLFETGDPSSDRGVAAGAGAMVRLPTGTQEDPGNFFDSGDDAQMDVEVRGWMNGRWRGGFGLWADLRYGLQLPGSTVRRVFDPASTFAPRASEATLDWNPGDYQLVELVPWYRLSEPLSLMAGIRHFRKAADAFSLPAVPEEGAALPAVAVDPTVLVPGTSQTLTRLQLGMVYNRAASAGDFGAVADPLEIRVLYRRAISGSGNAPLAQSLEVGFRFFTRVWGSRATE